MKEYIPECGILWADIVEWETSGSGPLPNSKYYTDQQNFLDLVAYRGTVKSKPGPLPIPGRVILKIVMVGKPTFQEPSPIPGRVVLKTVMVGK